MWYSTLDHGVITGLRSKGDLPPQEPERKVIYTVTLTFENKQPKV